MPSRSSCRLLSLAAAWTNGCHRGYTIFAQSHVVEFRTPERCRKWLCLKIIGRKTTKSWWFISMFTIEFSDFKGIPDFRHAQMVFFPNITGWWFWPKRFPANKHGDLKAPNMFGSKKNWDWYGFWVNYNISLTWIKAIWGWFPLLTMIIVRSRREVVMKSTQMDWYSMSTSTSYVRLQVAWLRS